MPVTDQQLTYSTANEQDIPALIQLCIASYTQYKDHISADNWDTLYGLLTDADNYIKLLRTGKSFICSNTDGVIVGMAFLIYHGNPWLFYPEDWSYLRMIGVHPGYGGKGIGKELTKMCMDEARNAGEYTIGLHTSALMDAARHIYEKLGFRQVEELPEKFGMRYFLYRMDL